MFTNIIVSFSDLVLWYLTMYSKIIVQMHLQLNKKFEGHTLKGAG